MSALFTKVVACPLVVWVGSSLGLLHFASWAQIIGVGLFLALLSMLADSTILPRTGNLPSTLLDWAAATVLLWASGALFRVPFAGNKGVEVCLPDCGPRLERRTA